MCVDFEETQSEDIHSVCFMLCFHDWLSNCLRCCGAFNWDVSCWCVGGDWYRTISTFVAAFMFFYIVVCLRVLCVASFWFYCNYVLDLICLMLHEFPEVCICKWRVLNWFMCSIFECNRSLFFQRKVELVMSCQQFAGRHLVISKHVSGEFFFFFCGGVWL